MSARRDLEAKLETMGEIREIMSSLKTLALVETRKLAHLAAAQRQAVETVRSALGDLSAHFPVADWQPECTGEAIVVLGSERGFCGIYNEQLFDYVVAAHTSRPTLRVVATGAKFVGRLEAGGIAPIEVRGADVAEEAQKVLAEIAVAVTRLQQAGETIALSVVYQDPQSAGVMERNLFPVLAPPTHAGGCPPVFNLPPQQLFVQLLEEYLYVQLHAAFFDALARENQMRMLHLEGALRHIDEQRGDLEMRRNMARQEEITEEIEVILLSAEAAAETD